MTKDLYEKLENLTDPTFIDRWWADHTKEESNDARQ